jgi:hypothetical protein
VKEVKKDDAVGSSRYVKIHNESKFPMLYSAIKGIQLVQARKTHGWSTRKYSTWLPIALDIDTL